MKKILSVFLSLSLCAMMAACGGQSSSAPATPAAPASSGGNEAATPSVAAKTFKLGLPDRKLRLPQRPASSLRRS